MILVYVGPSLDRQEPVLQDRRITLRAPIRHGDLLNESLQQGDTVVIIDGLYHQVPALRHKEILGIMSRGVRVIGAASIGALRAAELDSFGMLGVGQIYDAYRRNEFSGDDEVAVGQSLDGKHALSVPLVNLRYVLKEALTARVVTREQARSLLDAFREIFYAERTIGAVKATCVRMGHLDFLDWFEAGTKRDAEFGNLKRIDAMEAVRAATKPPTPGATTAMDSETEYTRAWVNGLIQRDAGDGFDLNTSRRLVYQQVFDPNFPLVWQQYLEVCWRNSKNRPPKMTLSQHAAAMSGGQLQPFMLFYPKVDLLDSVTVSRLLINETTADRESVAAFSHALAAERSHRSGFMTSLIRADLSAKLLRHVWQISSLTDAHGDFDAAATSRGFLSGSDAIEATKWLVPGAKSASSDIAERTA